LGYFPVAGIPLVAVVNICFSLWKGVSVVVVRGGLT